MTDHRAEAERALANAARAADSAKPQLEHTYLQYAQVHATLAGAPVVVDQDVSEALTNARIGLDRTLGDLIELRDAVRDYVDNIGDDEVEGAPRFARLRALVGGAS